MRGAMAVSASSSGAYAVDVSVPVDGLDENIRRIEHLLENGRATAGEPALHALLRTVANWFGMPFAIQTEVLPGESPQEALYRLADQADLLVRTIRLDDAFFASGMGPVICERVSDGSRVALVRAGRRWMIHDPARPGQPVKLDAVAQRDMASKGFQLGPCLPAKPISQWDLMRFGWRMVWVDLVGYAAMTALAGMILALFPIVASTIITVIVPGRELVLLAEILMFLVVLGAASLGVHLASSLAQVRIDGTVGSALRSAAIHRAVGLPAENRVRVPPPIVALAVRAVEGWHRAVWKLILSLGASVLMALPSLVVMAAMAPIAALAVLAAILLSFGVAVYFSRRQQAAMTATLAGSPASWMATAYETFKNIDTVRATGSEIAMFTRWSDGFIAQQTRQLAMARIGVWPSGLAAGLEAFLVLVAVGAIILSGAALPVEASVPFIMATTSVVGAAMAMMAAISEIGMLALQKRLAQPLLLGIPARASAGEQLMAPRGAVRVVSVSFRHHADNPPVLVDVNLNVEPGEYVGIVGASGSGKSTLLNVMLGMKTPETGAVFLDGVDISKLDMRAMRQRIGIVGQGACLFPGTLRENINLGLELADERLWDCLVQAGIDQDIAAMPLGLGTIIGDTNAMLSGGQVQRLLFARALAAEPRLIVLDEATSALDPAAQAIITRTIRRLGISVIAVAHRLETLRACDRIYVLDRGTIVQHGTFDALAEAPGLFATFLHS